MESAIWQHIYRGKFPHLRSSNNEKMLTAAYATCTELHVWSHSFHTLGQKGAYSSLTARPSVVKEVAGGKKSKKILTQARMQFENANDVLYLPDVNIR